MDISGEGSFSGEGIYQGTLPGHKLEEIRALLQEYYGSGGLVPQRLFYVKGLYNTDCIVTWMCNIRPEDTYRRKIKLSPKTTG